MKALRDCGGDKMAKLTGRRGATDDEEIVRLYFDRDEAAIRETDRKYGKFLFGIAYNILHDRLDCEECRNDTYLGVIVAVAAAASVASVLHILLRWEWRTLPGALIAAVLVAGTALAVFASRKETDGKPGGLAR